jgi:hypothetical protein
MFKKQLLLTTSVTLLLQSNFY